MPAIENTGSFADRVRVAPPIHQPPEPDVAQFATPETVAGGREVVTVSSQLEQLGCPEVQVTTELERFLFVGPGQADNGYGHPQAAAVK